MDPQNNCSGYWGTVLTQVLHNCHDKFLIACQKGITALLVDHGLESWTQIDSQNKQLWNIRGKTSPFFMWTDFPRVTFYGVGGRFLMVIDSHWYISWLGRENLLLGILFSLPFLLQTRSLCLHTQTFPLVVFLKFQMSIEHWQTLLVLGCKPPSPNISVGNESDILICTVYLSMGLELLLEREGCYVLDTLRPQLRLWLCWSWFSGLIS